MPVFSVLVCSHVDMIDPFVSCRSALLPRLERVDCLHLIVDTRKCVDRD
jgi:hypothetical protein